MKSTRLFPVFSLVIISSIVLSGCQFLPFRETTAAQPPNTVDVRRGDLEVTATATGTVTLPQVAKLGFSGAVSGSQAGNTILAELNVTMGSRVTKGQVIARLDTSGQERDLLRYKNNLETAQLNLQKAREPLYKPEEIAKAEAAIPQAKANLEAAREALKKAQNPYTENDFAVAEAAVRKAEAEVRKAKAALIKAADDLKLTISRSDRAIQDAINAVGSLENPFNKTNKPSDFDIQKASEAVVLARRQADLDLTAGNNAIASAGDALASAEVALTSAQFNLNDMLSKKNGDPLDIKQKEASVVNAETSLSNAQQTLSLMKQPPDPLDIKLKELQVTGAKLALEDALLQLEKSTIIAPFDGVIGDFKAKVGDTIQPGSFFIPLVDPSQIRIDAYIEEFDVMSIRPGLPANITLDALPGQRLSGQVQAISPLSTVQQGVVRYAVTVNARAPGTGEAASAQGRTRPPAGAGTPGTSASRPGSPPPRAGSRGGNPPASTELKDGLSATASVVLNRKEDVLMVPNRALILQRGEQKVQVLVNGASQDRVVKTGISNDQFTEIVEGVSEGEKVVVQALPTRQGFMPKPGMGIPGLR